MTRVVINAPEWSRLLVKLARASTHTVALAAESYKERLEEKQYPPASEVGEHPARRTGQLADSVDVVRAFPSGTEIRAGMGILGTSGPGPYPPHQEPGGGHIIPLMFPLQRLGPHDSFLSDVAILRRRFRDVARF